MTINPTTKIASVTFPATLETLSFKSLSKIKIIIKVIGSESIKALDKGAKPVVISEHSRRYSNVLKIKGLEDIEQYHWE